jgi:hypothetical protein
MANKMTVSSLQGHGMQSADDLRRTFETAVCELYQPGLAVQKNLQYRMPIVQRRKLAEASPANAEKRAMSDAARALAQLWKVQPHAAR